MIADPYKLAKFQKSDFALFTAMWWPLASAEHLKILIFAMAWLFVWDDELDQRGGVHCEDLEAAERYRGDSVKFLE